MPIILPRLAWATLLCCGAAAAGPDLRSAALHDGAASADPALHGIWKAAVPPPGSMHGEFGNNDPIGLGAGQRIAADCSINWVDPDTRRLYCFSSATSLAWFLDAPHANLASAAAAWQRLKAAP